MLELTINNQIYSFNFGIGFLRDINKAVKVDVDGLKNVQKSIGLRYKLTQLQEFDTEALVEILLLANRGQNPKITAADLESFIDSDETDIDGLFEEVWRFLESANATKKMVAAWRADIEAEKAKTNQK
mgnify:CR=1 FL=1